VTSIRPLRVSDMSSSINSGDHAGRDTRYLRYRRALARGDRRPQHRNTSTGQRTGTARAPEKDPASIFGGFGGLGNAGAANVRQRYLLAAGAFRPSGAQVDFEYLVKDVRGRLAYTVAIERANVLYAGQTERQQQVLRATMIFRFEKGAWKAVHRHADTMVDLQLPTP
jgi:ketosteroid isomerase-like protein